VNSIPCLIPCFGSKGDRNLKEAQMGFWFGHKRLKSEHFELPLKAE
jgi:hypothetical protein